jgi:cobalt-zinc-cadmium efflux system outer membrane protein
MTIAIVILGSATLAGGRALAEPAGPAEPAEPAGSHPPIALSWDEARQRAEAASSLVRRARAERQVVVAGRVGAELLFPSNPVVAVQGGFRRENGVAGEREEGHPVAAHLEQTLEVAGQRSTRRAQVEREIEAATWRERVAVAEIWARTRATYVGVQLADAQVQAAARRVALVERLIEGVRARVESGAASTVDLQLARVEEGQARRAHLTAGLGRATAETELRALLALEPGVPLVLRTPLGMPAGWSAGVGPAGGPGPGPSAPSGGANDPKAPSAPSAPSAPNDDPSLPIVRSRLLELLGKARAQRAELRALASSGQALDAELTRLTREAVPNPTLFIDAGRDLPGQVFVGAGLAIPLPVWRRNQGERATNRAVRQLVSVEAAVTEREIDAEVERALRTVLTESEIVRTWESLVLPAAESAVELITEGWRAGKFDLFRVIQASREASEARRGHLESLGDLWQASIGLARAVGSPPDSE